jgi:hypothetical protein
MHQNVVSAFPAKRLIIKRVKAVVPHETGIRVKRKTGSARAGEKGESVTRGRREAARIGETIF